jgi:hypothetical protein
VLMDIDDRQNYMSIGVGADFGPRGRSNDPARP